MNDLAALRKEMKKIASPKRAQAAQRYFKTGPGQYGHGDVFIGLTSPQVRTLCRRYAALPRRDVLKLLHSKIHEERLLALLMLVRKFQKADVAGQKDIFDLYLANTKCVNNWDLVDLSAPGIVGEYLVERPRQVLRALAKSPMLWERRIAVLATFAFIRRGECSDALRIAELLLDDEHDLIHKAVGWMLREVGKRSPADEERFLDAHAATMPRTMLRYAIEKFPEPQRRHYLEY